MWTVKETTVGTLYVVDIHVLDLYSQCTVSVHMSVYTLLSTEARRVLFEWGEYTE